MMNAVVNKTITLTADWQRLSAVSLVASVAIAALHTNAASAEFRVNGGSAQEWPVGGSFPFTSIDLYHIEVRGEPGDKIVIASGDAIALPASAGSVPPVPTLATIYEDNSEALIEFSEPLVWPPLQQDPSPFRFRHAGQSVTFSNIALVDGKLVFSNWDDISADPGEDRAILIDPPTSLVGSISGLHLQPFDFPLTVVGGKD